MSFDRVAAVDQDGQLPDLVRQRMADNLGDPSTPEGERLITTFVPGRVATTEPTDMPTGGVWIKP